MSYNYDHLHVQNDHQEDTRSYMTRYVSEIRHKGLGTFRIIKDLDSWILFQKVEAQFNKWDEQWSRIDSRNKAFANKAANERIADERTNDAKEKLEEVEQILLHTLDHDDTINWNSLKDKRKFSKPNPKKDLPNELDSVILPAAPTYKQLPPQPDKAHFQPKFSFLDNISGSRKSKKLREAEELYQSALHGWQEEVRQVELINEELKHEYNSKLQQAENGKLYIQKKYDSLHRKWEDEMDAFYKEQVAHNDKIDRLKELYFEGDPLAVAQCCELVFTNSEYPDEFPKDFELDYNPNNNLLVVDYVLPSPDQLPRLTEVKFIASRGELKIVNISDTQLAKMYDTCIYNICLRTLHEIFEADKASAIDAMVFNGWVNTINKATGKPANNCIISVQVKKPDFMEIDLANVDPKACFKNLKGVGSSKLSSLVAIQPVIQINRTDRRFVESQDIAEKISEGYNIAILAWEEFEHLIRQIFEMEFSHNGGEVKVTQASRDGGVDAIAFDPDPIRGGKIVIQAKRYTNTVGVSAVRDLYGTVMNEGATKGILVTTADYGPDAYEFAKNKPITLLNGSNLLYLLEKHGHKARIDLAEAKKMNPAVS